MPRRQGTNASAHTSRAPHAPHRRDTSSALFALRGFRRAPAFPALVIATLAVGIGGTVAMFSVMDAVLFAGLPYPDGDRMVMIWNRHTTSVSRSGGPK